MKTDTNFELNKSSNASLTNQPFIFSSFFSSLSYLLTQRIIIRTIEIESAHRISMKKVLKWTNNEQNVFGSFTVLINAEAKVFPSWPDVNRENGWCTSIMKSIRRRNNRELSLDCIFIRHFKAIIIFYGEAEQGMRKKKWNERKKKKAKQNKSIIKTSKDPHFRMKFNENDFNFGATVWDESPFVWIHALFRYVSPLSSFAPLVSGSSLVWLPSLYRYTKAIANFPHYTAIEWKTEETEKESGEWNESGKTIIEVMNERAANANKGHYAAQKEHGTWYLLLCVGEIIYCDENILMGNNLICFHLLLNRSTFSASFISTQRCFVLGKWNE